MENSEAVNGSGVEVDWVLQGLVRLVNGGVSFGVTITTPAGIVTGDLIGGKAYFQKMNELVAGTHLAPLTDLFDSYSQVYSVGDEEVPPPQFIHLANARHMQGTAFVPTQGTLWRGKISDVVGFSLGTLS